MCHTFLFFQETVKMIKEPLPLMVEQKGVSHSNQLKARPPSPSQGRSISFERFPRRVICNESLVGHVQLSVAQARKSIVTPSYRPYCTQKELHVAIKNDMTEMVNSKPFPPRNI